jgi:hypothetical protein
MKDNTEPMDKAIKEKFDGHEVSVPSGLWNSIESNLPSENESKGGNFFFKNSFLLSVLFVSTTVIGIYLYNFNSKQTIDSIAVARKTSTPENTFNTSAIEHSTADSHKQSSAKQKQPTDFSSSILAKENQSAHSSNILTESASTKDLLKNTEKNTLRSYTNSTHLASASSKKNEITKTSRSSKTINRVLANTGKKKPGKINNVVVVTKSNKPDLSNAVSNKSIKTVESGNEKNNIHSNSLNANTSNLAKPVKVSTATVSSTTQKSDKSISKNNVQSLVRTDSVKVSADNTSNLSEQTATTTSAAYSTAQTFNKTTSENNIQRITHADSINPSVTNTFNQSETSTITRAAETSATQTSAKNASENNLRTPAHADSIKAFASGLIQTVESFDNIAYTDSNTHIQTSPTADNTKTNSTNPSVSNSDTNLNISSIRTATSLLNATNTLSTPVEIASLYNMHTNNNNVSGVASPNHTASSNTDPNAVTTASNKNNTFIDSVNTLNSIENYFHTNSTSSDNTILTPTTNESNNNLFLQIDSTINTAPAEISSITKQPETLKVKSDVEKKKSDLFLSRCSFDGYATPALGYMFLFPNNNQEGINEITKERNKNARTGFGFTTGLRMNYALTQKIEIGIGFQYSSSSQQSPFNKQYTDSVDTYQGYTKIDSTYDTTSHHIVYSHHFVVTDTTTIGVPASHIKTYTSKFQNFSIPIHIAYGYSISDKFSLLARTSILINYQTYSVTYLNTIDSSIIGYRSGKKISLSGSFSIGGYYQFSKKCSVFLEPIVTYSFSNLFDKQVPFKQKQLMLGLQTGIRFSF